MALLLPKGIEPVFSSETSDADRLLAVIQKMVSEFEKVEDLTSEIEVVYYKEGVEDQHYQLRYYFKKKKKFRVDFHHPYKGVTVFYKGGDEKLTVRPFRFLPSIKLGFSIYNFMVRTPSGQRIDQTDVKYFLQFILGNINYIQKKETEFQEDGERIELLFWALDYIEGKNLEQYRMVVSKKDWLPIRIERYNRKNKPIETIIFKEQIVNTHLKDKIFTP